MPAGDSIGPQICQAGDCEAEHEGGAITGSNIKIPDVDSISKSPMNKIRLTEVITIRERYAEALQ
jgi:hypothetical protein